MDDGRDGKIVREHLGADVHVLAHLLALGGGQAAHLVHQIGRQPNETDVLEQPAHAQGVQIVRRHAQVATKGHQVDRHRQRVVVGFVIGALEFRQPEQRVGIAHHALDQSADRALDMPDFRQFARRYLLADVLEQFLRIFVRDFGGRQFLLDMNIVDIPDGDKPVAAQFALTQHRQRRQGQLLPAGVMHHFRLRRGGGALAGDEGAGRIGAVFVAEGTCAVDGDETAQIAQLCALLLVLDEKTLDQKRRTQPRPVEVGNEHAQAQVQRGNDLRHRRRTRKKNRSSITAPGTQVLHDIAKATGCFSKNPGWPRSAGRAGRCDRPGAGRSDARYLPRAAGRRARPAAAHRAALRAAARPAGDGR